MNHFNPSRSQHKYTKDLQRKIVIGAAVKIVGSKAISRVDIGCFLAPILRGPTRVLI